MGTGRSLRQVPAAPMAPAAATLARARGDSGDGDIGPMAGAGCGRHAGNQPWPAQSKGRGNSWAKVILGLQHPAESTRPELKVKLHPSFLMA